MKGLKLIDQLRREMAFTQNAYRRYANQPDTATGRKAFERWTAHGEKLERTIDEIRALFVEGDANEHV